ncbi:MAG TPA: hypothetical protein VN132_05205, partial [Bdellovibrio sp.]|nr:hypothetical protein [Bdellovibrio sp.]
LTLPASEGEYTLVKKTGSYNNYYTGGYSEQINLPGVQIRHEYRSEFDSRRAKETTMNDAQVGIQIINEHLNDLEKTTTTMAFYGLSSDGNSLLSEVQYRMPNLDKYIVSGSDVIRVREKWTFESCDGEIIEFAPRSGMASVESIRALDFRRYMNCTLSNHKRSCSETDTNFFCLNNESSELVFKDNGSIERDFRYKSSSEIFKANRAFDANKQAQAEQATESLINLLKDYGLVLINTSKMKQIERNAAIKGWMSRNQSQVLNLLNTIETNLPDTTTLSKLNILMSINKADKTIADLEAQVGTGSSFDEVIRIQVR